MGKKITAYKVTNLSKVDPRFYIEGDHFLTDRSVGILSNGKIKTIQGNDQIEEDFKNMEKDLKEMKTTMNDLIDRIEALEEVEPNE